MGERLKRLRAHLRLTVALGHGLWAGRHAPRLEVLPAGPGCWMVLETLGSGGADVQVGISRRGALHRSRRARMRATWAAVTAPESSWNGLQHHS